MSGQHRSGLALCKSKIGAGRDLQTPVRQELRLVLDGERCVMNRA
jgi:hypothetical protein